MATPRKPLMRKPANSIQIDLVPIAPKRRRKPRQPPTYVEVYARLRSGKADQPAETAIRWIQAHGNVCTVRDLQQHSVAGLTRASQAEKLLRDLVDLGSGGDARAPALEWTAPAGGCHAPPRCIVSSMSLSQPGDHRT
jgi:hypothetical protein